MANESNRDVESQREELTHPEARSALVTASGIALGLEIAFGVGWMQNPQVWEPRDWWFGVPFALSSLLLLLALGKALYPYKQTITHYEVSVKIFLSGIVLAFIAIFLSVLT